MSHYYTTMHSPMGEIVLTSDGKSLTGLHTPKGKKAAQAKKGEHKPEYFREAVKQLNEYFAGKRNAFDLPLAPEGTDFEKRVWKALLKIGYGKTASYADLAKSIQSPAAFRAVGNANGKNPIAIIIPCHRVIASDGTLGGYSGGLKVKEWLLSLEKGGKKAA